MGAKRHRKVKGGRAAAEAAAAVSEGGQNLSNQYEGTAEVKPSNYVLLYVEGKVGSDKRGGDTGSADGGRPVEGPYQIRGTT